MKLISACYSLGLCLLTFAPGFAQVVTPGVPLTRSRSTATAATVLQDPQSRIVTPDGVMIVQPGMVDGGVVPPTAVPGPALPVPRTRIQAIGDIEIDLRPSGVLETWSSQGSMGDVERPPSPLGAEMARLKWQITMGQWSGFASYLADLEDADESFEIYKALLKKIASTPTGGSQPTHPAGQAFREKNVLGTDDIYGLLIAAPQPHDDDTVGLISRLIASAVQTGNTAEGLIGQLASYIESESTNESPTLTRRQGANILHGANLRIHLAEFLPTSEEAIAADDAEALNLLATYYLARYAKDREQADLEEAWNVTQSVLASPSADDESQEKALAQAVSLSATVREELGQAWLDGSFSNEPERGMRILATVGQLTSKGLMTTPTAPTSRLKNLKLLTTSVESMLENSPELAEQWQSSLSMLALAWLQEADLANRLDRSTSRGPIMRYDTFGNPYFMDENQMMQMQQSRQNQPRAIPVADLLENRPSDAWIGHLDESLQPRFREWLARLFLKVQEEDNAFPYIEGLAETQPDIAKELVNEFLSVWAANHDPNSGRRLRSPIFAIYGFSQRAEGIPLTRSKQERNLRELAEWITRLRALPLGDAIDERLLVRAFTVSHSSAEVYELEAIENVFGDIENLDPVTISGLAQQMRANLAGLWREPDVQKQNQTNRRKKDIEAEVTRGYMVANQVIDNALTKHENHWALLLAKAALTHDEVNYRHEISKSSAFTAKRLEALAAFQAAAAAYIDQLDDIGTDKESTEAFELWFNASLGACDVRQLDAEKLPILSEPRLIREALDSMPPDAAERHLAKFANSLFTTLRSVNPSVKYRFLKCGFEIVGDHEQAVEAKKVFDYYDDLVTEIELQTVVDGTTNVGSNQPFGIFVNLRHTREIERESGGFGRYLQNQNNVQYAYNYGRPTENYRDKFEEGVREVLGEHFEILSVTFQSEDVNSKADSEYGWRITPYAYVLAKARGDEVDRIPPVKLDLDFLDTSGYVVLPIESPMVPIDASPSNADPRPVDVLSVIQTLDERQSKDGKLILEIKATTHGLPPELDELVKLDTKEFDVLSIDDQGASVSRFDPEADDTVVVGERLWTVTMEGRTDLTELPDEFTFGTILPECKDSQFQRYVDADLETVAQTIPLEENYGETDRTLLFVVLGLSAIGLVGIVGFVFMMSRKRDVTDQSHIHLPHEITPFSVIGVLREIHRNNGLNHDQKDQLEADIHRLEGEFFAPNAQEDADLKKVVEKWLKRARV